MDPAKLFVIGDIEGFTPEVARLVSMMHYARWTTLEAVRGLSVTEIDHLQDPQSNSIGALLLHVAAVEVSYQALTFLGRGLTGEELLQWEPALELGELGRARIRGYPIEYYLRVLALVRESTLTSLRERDDRWLHEERPFWGGRRANHHFMWFHVLEDELNHRGQIRWLRRRLPRDPRLS